MFVETKIFQIFAAHLLSAIVVVVCLARSANQPHCLENWKHCVSEANIHIITTSLIVRTVVAGEVFIDPRKPKLGRQNPSEAHIHIVGVEGRLDCVLVTKQIMTVTGWRETLQFSSDSYTVQPRHFQCVTSKGLRNRGYTFESLPNSISTQDPRWRHTSRSSPVLAIMVLGRVWW